MAIRFGFYNPAAQGWSAPPKSIMHFSYRGNPFPGGVANDDIRVIFTQILTEIEEQSSWRIRDIGNWGYNYRPIRAGQQMSFHAYGLAIDIDAPNNPSIANGGHAPHTLPAVTSGIARKYGCEWGGDWTKPRDYMHVQFHGTPADAKRIADEIRRRDSEPEPEEEEPMIMHAQFAPGAMTRADKGEFARKVLQFPSVGRALTVSRAFLHFSAQWVPDMEHMPRVRVWVTDGYAQNKFLYDAEFSLPNTQMNEMELPKGANKVIVEVLNSPPGAVVSFDVELVK